jgi:hypothetical protein
MHTLLEAAIKAKLTSVVVSTALHTDKHAEWRVSQADYPLRFAVEEAGGLAIGKWASKAGMYTCEPGKLEQYGLTLPSFEEWVMREQVALKKLLG